MITDNQTFEKAFTHTFGEGGEDLYVITQNVIGYVFDGLEENKEFPDRNDIYRGVDDALISAFDQWDIMRCYQTPREADYEEAYYDYITDITSMVEYITKRSLDE